MFEPWGCSTEGMVSGHGRDGQTIGLDDLGLFHFCDSVILFYDSTSCMSTRVVTQTGNQCQGSSCKSIACLATLKVSR